MTDALNPASRADALILFGATGDLAFKKIFSALQSMAGWVEPVLGNAAALYEYEAGTWGPVEAGRLTEPYGGWVNPGPRQSA